MSRVLGVCSLCVWVGLAASCGDDDSSADDDIVVADAADEQPRTDAAPRPDAAPTIDADLTPDAPPTDATPPGTATITLFGRSGAPLEGIVVVFSDRTGALISAQTTDANGLAEEVVPARAMITVGVSRETGKGASGFQLFTVRDVQPGDALQIRRVDPAGPPTSGSVTVRFPGQFGGVTSYNATEGCNSVTTGDPPTDSSLTIGTGCLVNGNSAYHVLAQGVDDMGAVQAYALIQNNPVAGQTVTLPAWSNLYDTVTTTLTNPPAGALAWIGDGSFDIDGVPFDLGDQTFGFFLGDATWDAKFPRGLAPSRTETDSFVIFGEGLGVSALAGVLRSKAGVANPGSHNLANEVMLPAPTGPSVTMTNPARPSLNWSGAPVGADIGQAQLLWADGANQHNWSLIFDPTRAGPVQMPDLTGTGLEGFAPTGSAQYDLQSVSYVDADWFESDWDAVRQAGGIPVGAPSAEFTIRLTGPFFTPPMVAPSSEVAVRTALPSIIRSVRQVVRP